MTSELRCVLVKRKVKKDQRRRGSDSRRRKSKEAAAEYSSSYVPVSSPSIQPGNRSKIYGSTRSIRAAKTMKVNIVQGWAEEQSSSEY